MRDMCADRAVRSHLCSMQCGAAASRNGPSVRARRALAHRSRALTLHISPLPEGPHQAHSSGSDTPAAGRLRAPARGATAQVAAAHVHDVPTPTLPRRAVIGRAQAGLLRILVGPGEGGEGSRGRNKAQIHKSASTEGASQCCATPRDAGHLHGGRGGPGGAPRVRSGSRRSCATAHCLGGGFRHCRRLGGRRG